MTERFLPYGRHCIEADDIAAVTDVLKGDWLTTGPSVAAFEAELAKITTAPYAVVCSNATNALHLTARALGLKAGDKVIVPSITFLASANGFHFTGAEIVFADVDAATGLMTPESFEDAIKRAGGNVKAAVPVHLNGNVCDMPNLAAIAKQHNIILIEDACHAIGGAYQDDEGKIYQVGSCAHSAMTTFSFHPVKTIAMGEGGAITTRDQSLLEELKLLRSHGMVRDAANFENHADGFAPDQQPNPWYYEMQDLGYNYRAPDINCALGLSQLKKLPRFSAERRALSKLYREKLSSLSNLVTLLPEVKTCNPVLHLFVVKIDFEKTKSGSRGAFMRALHAQGIGTQVHYYPVHLQPYYQKRYGKLSLPHAERYYQNILSIPYFAGLTTQEAERVVQALREQVVERAAA